MGFFSPTAAQKRFAEKYAKRKPSLLERPKEMSENEKHWRRKLEGQGNLKARKPDARESIADVVAKVVSRATAKKVAGLADVAPILGDALAASDAKRAWDRGEYGKAAGLAGLAAIGSVPGVGDAVGKVAEAAIMPLFHGSDKLFSRFSNDFIGKGEGAQGYGYGHYLSESQRLAGSYRNPRMEPGLSPDSGHLYEVAVDAEPQDFIALDKALREQPDALQELARKADLSHLPPGMRSRVVLERFARGEPEIGYPATGQHLHSALTNYGADTEANRLLSERLAREGFAGIQYGQPRDALGGGGRNYVVFDPDKIDILSRR